MPRTARAAVGGVVYHLLNRGNGRMEIFREPEDHQAFIELMIDAKRRADVEIFGFCLMPNHWHLVVRPQRDRDLAAYLSWLSNTHVKRYRSLPSEQRTSLPGPVQKFPGAGGLVFFDAAALRRGQSRSRQAGDAGTRLAVVEPGLHGSDFQTASGRLADRSSRSMDGAGERADRAERAGPSEVEPGA